MQIFKLKKLKIIGITTIFFILIFYVIRIQAQSPVTSLIQLQVCGGAGSCHYGTSLNLGSQGASYSALIFSGSFSSPFRCEDINGQTNSRAVTIQSSDLIDTGNSNYIIPANNVELKNSPSYVVVGNCPIDQGTTSWTPIGTMSAVILGKTYSVNQICKIQSDTVSLKVTTQTGQQIGHYSGSLTITVQDFSSIDDCRSAVDPNCPRPDTIINYYGSPMRWAGCNSTLGSGIGITYYGENANGSVYDCSGTNLGNLSQFYSSTGKEIDISSGCKIDNIFGKLYKRYPEGSGMGTDLACPYGRHLPSDAERKILEQTYGMIQGINSYTGGELYIENYYNDIYGSDGWRGKFQGWKYTQLGFLSRDLGFPLAGKSALGTTYSNLGINGYYRTQTLSGGSNNTAWMRDFFYNSSELSRMTTSTLRYNSVRCIRNCPSDFVCQVGERCEVDASCCNNDINFTYLGNDYTRAGCNSTLGDMANDSSIMQFNGISVFDCNGSGINNPPYLFNTKELQLGPVCKINNNFGKLYQRDDRNGKGLYNNCKGTTGNDFIGTINNSNCPCPDGWHVPISSEWDALKDYYTSLGGINGWSGNQSGVVWNLQLPLAGYCTSPNACFGLGGISYLRGANYTPSLGEAQLMGYNISSFAGTYRDKENYNTVRCIKD